MATECKITLKSRVLREKIIIRNVVMDVIT